MLTGEAPQITTALSEAVDSMGAISLWVLIGTFSVFGMLLNYSMFLCTMLNSALVDNYCGSPQGAAPLLRISAQACAVAVPVSTLVDLPRTGKEGPDESAGLCQTPAS